MKGEKVARARHRVDPVIGRHMGDDADMISLAKHRYRNWLTLVARTRRHCALTPALDGPAPVAVDLGAPSRFPIQRRGRRSQVWPRSPPLRRRMPSGGTASADGRLVRRSGRCCGDHLPPVPASGGLRRQGRELADDEAPFAAIDRIIQHPCRGAVDAQAETGQGVVIVDFCDSAGGAVSQMQVRGVAVFSAPQRPALSVGSVDQPGDDR